MSEAIKTEDRKELSYDELANHLENGDYPAAEEAIHALLERSPDDVELLNSLGSIYAQRGDYFNAESAFRKAIELDPDCGDAYYNLGLAYGKQSRKTEAVEEFLKAVEINPGDFAAHNDLGVLYHSQGKSQLAKDHFIKALEANILYKRALLNLFEVCWDADTYSEGLAWVEKYLKAANPDFETPVLQSVSETLELSKPVISETKDSQTELENKPSRGILKFTKKSSSESDAIFLKHVPEELREEKTGVNIAIAAEYDITGQLSLLFRMINRYTRHKARMIILRDDGLECARDLNLLHDGEEAHKEALNIIERADFYHLAGFPAQLDGVSWDKCLKPYNSLIQHFATEIKIDTSQISKWHNESGIPGLSCGDYTMIEKAPLFYHINIMCDFSRIKPCSVPKDIVRICHSPDDRQSMNTDMFLSIVETLANEGYPVELELIEGKTKEECLDIKSGCHITYGQVSVGMYGISVVESMAAGHAVLAGVSNFASSCYPDNPIVYATEGNLREKLEYLLDNKNEITRIGNAGKIWAANNHDPMKIIRQYVWIYDLVMNGYGIVDGRDKFLLK